MLIISSMSLILIILWLLILALFFLFLSFFARRRQNRGQAADDMAASYADWGGQEECRLAAVLLIGSGLALVWMGQTVYAKVPLPEQLFVFVVTAVGMASFFFGGQVAIKKQFPLWLIQLILPLLRFFEISVGQLCMLFFALCFAGMARLAAGDALLARQSAISVVAWLFALILAVFGFYPTLQRGKFNFGRKVNITKKDWIVVAVFFLAALLLRGVALGQYPRSFSGDEGSVGIHALLFLNGEADNLFTGGWFSFPSLYFALLSGSIALFGQTIEAIRLTSAFGGALAVVGTYFLGRTMFDRVTAVFAAGYLLVSHYHIHMSRIALNNIWDSVFVAIAFAAFWYGWQNNERIGFVVGGIALGLGQYFYVTIRILPILFLLWAMVAWWRKRDMFRQRFSGLVVTAFVAFVIVLPLGLYFAGHLPEFNAPLNRVTIAGPLLAQMSEATDQSKVVIVLNQMKQAALGYTHEPLKLLYNPGSPLLLSGAASLFLLGILWGLLHFDLRILLLFLPLLSVIVTSGLSQDPPASQRFVLTMPIVAVFIALPLALVFRWLRELWPKHKWLATAVTAVMLFWIALLDVHYYFIEIADSYVYGGYNTVVATEIGTYLNDHETQDQKVYFFGFPRMGYFSLSTIPYLAPSMVGEDVLEEITEPPTWAILRPTLFLFLPERIAELALVRESYPAGKLSEFKNEKGETFFTVYEVSPP